MIVLQDELEYMYSEIRREAQSLLKRKGFPLKHRHWKYSNVLSMLSKSFAYSSEAKTIHLNGKILKEDIIFHTMGSFILPQNSFSLLSLTYLNKLSGIYLKNGDKLETSMSSRNTKETALLPSLFVYIQENSKVEIVERDNCNSLYVPLTFISLGKGASLKYTKIQNSSGYVVDNTIIKQEDNSNLETLYFSTGSQLLRNNLYVYMQSSAKANLKGAYAAKEHVDNFLRVEHLGNNSESIQTYKGLVKGQCSFLGSIFVGSKAENNSAYQLNKSILKSGSMNTSPELEILNENVKCSHGATVASFNEDEIFYLNSRGIKKSEAEELLSKEFINELIPSEFKDEINQLIKEKYGYF